MSFETSFDSKQPKLEPKLVSALSETKRLFRLFRFYTETESFDVSTEPKQTEDQPKQERKKEHLFIFFRLYMIIMDSTHIRLRIATHSRLLLRLILYTHVHHDRVLEHLIRG